MSILLPENYQLVQIEATDSTNAELKRLLKHGAPEYTVVSAQIQQDGRGRKGRSWVSQPGNLFFSWVFNVEKAHYPQALRHLPYIISMAILKAIPSHPKLAVKWPNDILIHNKKLAGILLESHQTAEGCTVVAGVGINTCQSPQDIDQPTTSLLEEGIAILNTPLLCQILENFDNIFSVYKEEGFGLVRDVWLSYCDHIPNEGKIRTNEGMHQGYFTDIAEDGALIFQTETRLLHLHSGEIVREEALAEAETCS